MPKPVPKRKNTNIQNLELPRKLTETSFTSPQCFVLTNIQKIITQENVDTVLIPMIGCGSAVMHPKNDCNSLDMK